MPNLELKDGAGCVMFNLGSEIHIVIGTSHDPWTTLALKTLHLVGTDLEAMGLDTSQLLEEVESILNKCYHLQ